MKAEVLISLISAVGLHAGLFCVGGGHRDLPRSTTEIEIGLEAGDDAPPAVSASETPAATEEQITETVETQPVELPTPPAPPVEADAPAPPDESPAPEPMETPPPASPVFEKPVEVPPSVTPAKPEPAPRKIEKAVSTKKSSKATRSSSSEGGGGRGSNISSARYRYRAPLRYPSSAFSQHVGGTVVLTIQINESGRATDVTVKKSSGNNDLDAAAVQCARSSRYEPYRVNGLPEPCSVVAPFQFDPR